MFESVMALNISRSLFLVHVVSEISKIWYLRPLHFGRLIFSPLDSHQVPRKAKGNTSNTTVLVLMIASKSQSWLSFHAAIAGMQNMSISTDFTVIDKQLCT